MAGQFAKGRRHWPLSRAWRFLSSFAPDQKGAALVEFALVAPFLVALAIGGFDFGLVFFQKQKVASAAHAGAQYAAQTRNSAYPDPAEIELRVREDAGDTNNTLTVTPRYYCVCPDSTAEVVCGDSDACPGAERPQLMYVEVDVQKNVHLIFSYPDVSDSVQLQSLVRMRVR